MKRHSPDTGNIWKIGLLVMSGIFIAATVASLVVAKHRVSTVVDTEYYSHGLHYAETHSKAGNAGTGWTMTASVAGNYLQVLVRDEAGVPVTGGRVVYDLDRPAGKRTTSGLYLRESGPGIYRTPRPGDASGELRGTMRFTKGEATVSGKVVVIN